MKSCIGVLFTGHRKEIPVGVPEGGKGLQTGGTELPVAHDCQDNLHDRKTSRRSADAESFQQVPHR